MKFTAPGLSSILVGAAGALVLASSASAATVTLHDIPTAGSKPTQVIAGPDGRLWFTETGTEHQVGRFDPTTGQFAPVTLPAIDEATTDEGTVRLAASTNGSVWALDDGGQELYRIGADGSVSHALPSGGDSSYEDALSEPDEIVPAAGGGVWTLFPFHNPDLPGNAYNGASIVGDDGASHLVTSQQYQDDHPGALDPSDGSLWLADYAAVTHVSTDGTVRVLPTGLDATYEVSSAAIGPDGALWFTAYVSGSWFTDPRGGVIGHVVDNQVQLTPTSANSAPTSLRVGPDGALWWGETLAQPAGAPQGAIGRLNPATGVVQEGSIGNYQPIGIAFAGNGTLWFVDRDTNVIGQVGIDGALFPPAAGTPPPAPPAPPATQTKPPSTLPTVASTSLRVSKQRIPVLVSCPKAAKAACRGTVELRTAAKVKVKGRKKAAIVTVSSRGSYTVEPGKRATVKLKLSKTGSTVVRHGHSTKVTAELTPKGAKKAATTKKLTLRG